MKNILIPGTGCCSDSPFEQNVKTAAEEPGASIGLGKVDDLMKIPGFQVMSLPALLVNGEVRVEGRIAEVAELNKVLKP